MAVIATVIEFVRSLVEGIPVTDVKFDEGGEDNATGDLYQPAGFDAAPLAGDTVLAVRQPGEARWAVIGYIDPANQLTAAAGEARLFARDADGNIVGTILLDAAGFINLGEDQAPEFIPRDDRIQTQLDEIAANILDLQTAHNMHQHNAPNGASAPTVLTTETYSVGATATDKVKGT